MNVLVINCGSSSIKYQLFNMPSTQPVCSGLIERIGDASAIITHKTFVTNNPVVIERQAALPDHQAGLEYAVALLTGREFGVLKDPGDIHAVGHRVVHGGEKYDKAVLITDEVKLVIQQLFSLAPLHNPANYTGIEVAEKCFPKAEQVAVFDTAFHQTLPEFAFRYAIPRSLYAEDGIRAYGFHGTSHKYVSEKAIQWLGKPNAKIISIHLGNGCSMTAVANGHSVDTSMGFGPLSGLVMGTRAGDIDASVIFHLVENLGYAAADVSNLLNKKSGMLGLSGFNDMRDVNKAALTGHEAELALEIYAYRIKKYIGAYAAVLNGLDAILFTAGVGENDNRMRARICSDMDFLGITLDEEKNNIRSGDIREINLTGAPVKVLIVPTNEELEIAQQSFEIINDERLQ